MDKKSYLDLLKQQNIKPSQIILNESAPAGFKKITDLPSNVVKELQKVYKTKKNNPQEDYKNAWYWITSDDSNDKNMNLSFIKKYDLCPIFGYGNGDYAWYSLKNNNVYDYNHELNTFNDLAAGKRHAKNGLWLFTKFEDWLVNVINKKRDSAFKF